VLLAALAGKSVNPFGPFVDGLLISQRRAGAVKAYLTQPVTKPGDCTGTQKTSALIACLQPDRRVEVEVDGTRK